jgi:hypothetical protein
MEDENERIWMALDASFFSFKVQTRNISKYSSIRLIGVKDQYYTHKLHV